MRVWLSVSSSARVNRAVQTLLVAGGVGALVYLVVRSSHGFGQGDPVASVFGTAAALVLMLVDKLSQVLGLGKDAPEIGQVLTRLRLEVKDLREAEANDRGLIGGLLLPVTIGDPDVFGDGSRAGALIATPAMENPPKPVASMPVSGSGLVRVLRAGQRWLSSRRAVGGAADEGGEPSVENDVIPDAEELLWTPQQFQALWAGELTGGEQPIRYAIHGRGGAGKTTLALMLTLGLLASKKPSTPIPLLVSLSGYDGRVVFNKWINRRTRRLYPAVGQVPLSGTGERGPVGALLNAGQAMLVLDGFDEMPVDVRARAAAEIAAFVRDTESLILFSRAGDPDDVRRRIGVLAGKVEVATVNRPDVAQQQAYLRHRAQVLAEDGSAPDEVRDHGPERIRAFAAALEQDPALRIAVSSPMMLDLAARVIGRATVTIAELAELAGNETENATRSRVLAAHVDWALQTPAGWKRRPGMRVLGHKRSAQWLTYLARVMVSKDTHQLDWWRSTGDVSSVLLGVGAALSVLPSYYLALQMPVGLTRGLAIGCVIGVGAAFLRTRLISWMMVPAVFAVMFTLVMATGTKLLGWKQGTADGLEISSSVTAAFVVLDGLLRSRWPRRFGRPPRWLAVRRLRLTARSQRAVAARAAAGRVPWGWLPASARRHLTSAGLLSAAIPVALTAAVGLVGTLPPVLFRLAAGFRDHDRSPAMVFVGVTFGVILATVAARVYITKDETVPNAALLIWAPRGQPGIRPVLTGLLFATSIGLGGAVGRGLTSGPVYGLFVAFVFAFVAGFPVGLVGGMVQWLCTPLKSRIDPALRSVLHSSGIDHAEVIDEDARDLRPQTSAASLHSDRELAIAILAAITAVSAVSIWIMNQIGAIGSHIRAESPGYAIGPVDGLLVALSLGVIVACTYTVWPIFVFAHLWLVARRRLPWRLRLFAGDLQRARIIIRDGDVYRFRYAGMRTYLGETLYARVHQPENAGRLGSGDHDRVRTPTVHPEGGRDAGASQSADDVVREHGHSGEVISLPVHAFGAGPAPF